MPTFKPSNSFDLNRSNNLLSGRRTGQRRRFRQRLADASATLAPVGLAGYRRQAVGIIMLIAFSFRLGAKCFVVCNET